MTIPPIPTNRALVIIGEESILSPDAKKRIVQQYLKKLKLFKFTKFARLLSIPATIISLTIFFVISVETFGKIIFLIIGLISIILTYTSYLYYNKEYSNKLFKNIRYIDFPCPYCDNFCNISEMWICGNCRKVNNDELNEFAIPFYRCEEAVCTQPEQTAYQCPNCHKHVILDEKRYVAANSHKHPYKGVARFLQDKAEPTAVFVPKAKQFFDDD